jgi:hypothetical protein
MSEKGNHGEEERERKNPRFKWHTTFALQHVQRNPLAHTLRSDQCTLFTIVRAFQLR